MGISHPFLAAKALKLSFSPKPDRDDAARAFRAVAPRDLGPRARDLLKAAVDDAWARLLKPRAKREVLKTRLEAAKREAVRCFAENAEHLLTAAPLATASSSEAVVVGLDPGFKHGHKGAIVRRRDGACLASFVVPDPPTFDDHSPRFAKARDTLDALLKPYDVFCVAVGDGANSRGAQRLVAALEAGPTYAIVRECGASTYSATDLAAAELPDVCLARRGAVSLARRLCDPLAEYVKLDPATLGVGMYQKDLDARVLRRALDAAVEDAVAKVGVDVNSAGPELLARVAGLGRALAKRVAAAAPFASRDALADVKGLGPKTFANVAGFLRVLNDREPLDGTRVHPESYGAARRRLAAVGVDDAAVSRLAAAGGGLDAAACRALEAQFPGDDVARLLADPCLAGDPRKVLSDPPRLRATAPQTIADCHVGATFLGATVANVSPFGAFVDLGVGTDGLLHVSHLRTLGRALYVGAAVDVAVDHVDARRGRISLVPAKKRVAK